ncbi:MAG: ABC transporter permease, partial [Bacteroidota bacterium]
MFKSYFKIAWRNISRHKIFTIINVLGLSLGICACIVIYLVTSHDLSFDQFHPGKDRMYRIVGDLQEADGNKVFLNSPFDDVAGFQNQIPGFESRAAFHLFGEEVSISDGKNPAKKFGGRIESQEGWYSSSILTGPEYFSIFSYQWLAGNAKTALMD